MRICFRSFFELQLVILISAVLLSSCVQKETAPETKYEPATDEMIIDSTPAGEMDQYTQETYTDPSSFFTHTVKWNGESLSIIAAWYTGRLENWEELALYNPDLNPNLIHIGDQIRIPESMMTTTEPLPFDFVVQYVPSLKKGPPSVSKPAVDDAQSPEEKTEQPAFEKAEPSADEVEPMVETAGPSEKTPEPIPEEGEPPAKIEEPGQADAVDTEPPKTTEEEEEPTLFGPRTR